MNAMMKNMDSTIKAMNINGIDLNNFKSRKWELDEEIQYLQWEADYEGTLGEAFEDLFWKLEAEYDPDLLQAYKKACWVKNGDEWYLIIPSWTDVLVQFMKVILNK